MRFGICFTRCLYDLRKVIAMGYEFLVDCFA